MDGRRYTPLEREASEEKLSWTWSLIYWLVSLVRRRQWRKFSRIAKARKAITPLLEAKCPPEHKPKKVDYHVYEHTATFADIRDGLVHAPIVTDENNVTYVDQVYLAKLLQEIAQGESRLALSPAKVPPIIGLWDDGVTDTWAMRTPRCDTEEEYFACKCHAMQSYIDDEWDEDEKEAVYHYLVTQKQPVRNIVIGDSYCNLAGEGRICTDGKFLWHQSLEDYVLKYNVRPPAFFVDHILAQIKDREGTRDKVE
jgi:hypothetical protein